MIEKHINMAHSLLAISRPSKRASTPSVMSTDDGSSSHFTTTTTSNSNNNNSHSLSLRHQYSITSASTSSTLYTCSEEDEDDIEGANGDAVVNACEEVIHDSRLNGAGLPIPWHSLHSQENSNSTSSSGSRKSKEKAANHAMRFKRRGGGSSSRASLTTLGEDWLPRPASTSNNTASSPSKSTSSQASTSSPTKAVPPSCTCQLEEGSEDRSNEDEDDLPDGIGSISIDDQLDRMINMTSDLLRISKGVLTSSKRVSVTNASDSQVSSQSHHVYIGYLSRP